MKQESLCLKRPEVGKLKELAIDVNSIPLPNIPDTKQILLPPQEHSLIRNNFQIYTEELLKQLNINSGEFNVERNDKISEKASQFDISEEQSRNKGMRKDEEVSRPVQTVLRRKKNREVKISLDLGKKKEIHEENFDNVINQ